jgi:hypothetical protein
VWQGDEHSITTDRAFSSTSNAEVTKKGILVQLVELLCETRDPEGQVRLHVPFTRKYPGRQPVHWASFIVEAMLNFGILHDAQLGVTALQPKEMEFTVPTRLVER